jgi:hypothetical protein
MADLLGRENPVNHRIWNIRQNIKVALVAGDLVKELHEKILADCYPDYAGSGCTGIGCLYWTQPHHNLDNN